MKLESRTKSDHGSKELNPAPGSGKATCYAPESKTHVKIDNHRAVGHDKSIDPGKHMHSGKG